MTREEEIKSIVDALFGDKERTSEQAAAANGFEAGVRWADRHIDTTVLWRDTSHEPEEGKLIVCIDEDGDLHSGAFYDERADEYNRVYESAVWNYGELLCYWDDVKIWAYLNDLLPKTE